MGADDALSRILMTGGTGFVGSRLAERLRDRNTVYCLTREDEFRDNRVEGINYARGDLLDYEQVKVMVEDVRPEIIVHLAAYTPVRFSFDNPWKYANINYVGTLNVVEAAVKARKVEQIVYASTAEIYGPYATPHTVNEESVPDPTSPYSVAKMAGEHYVRYAKQRGIHFTVLRPTNSYGRSFALPDEARGYFVEKLIIGLLTQESVPFDGYPMSTRRFMYVDDHVHAYQRAIDNPKACDQVFNVAPDEQAVTLGEVAEMAKRLVGSDAEVKWGMQPRPMDPNHLDIDGTKVHRRLDWKAKYTLEQGIRRTVDYWRTRLSIPKKAVIE